MQQENQQHQGANMIEIKLVERDHRYTIKATGHAEYAPHGQDIVCAAVSTLLQTYGNYLESKEKARTWWVMESKLEPGDLIVDVLDAEDNVKELYRMTMDGLENIQYTYPECIKIEYNPKKI